MDIHGHIPLDVIRGLVKEKALEIAAQCHDQGILPAIVGIDVYPYGLHGGWRFFVTTGDGVLQVGDGVHHPICLYLMRQHESLCVCGGDEGEFAALVANAVAEAAEDGSDGMSHDGHHHMGPVVTRYPDDYPSWVPIKWVPPLPFEDWGG